MKTLRKIENIIECALYLNCGAFIGLAVAAAGMKNALLAITCILLFVNVIFNAFVLKITGDKIKDIKEKEWI